MNNKASKIATSRQRQDEAIARPKRADAQRKMNALLKAALDVFAESGVDAPDLGRFTVISRIAPT